jgi:hypothetical protein
MRITIVFFLVAGSLVLTIWAWNLVPQRFETIPMYSNEDTWSEEVGKINRYNDLELLRAHARELLVLRHEKAFERDLVTAKTSIILAVVALIAIVVQIILFYEIAGRGRARSREHSKQQ